MQEIILMPFNYYHGVKDYALLRPNSASPNFFCTDAVRRNSFEGVNTMAIFGVGAYYEKEKDVTSLFLANKVACIGWNYNEAPSLHKLMRHIKVGDIIYIKSYPFKQGLKIKAIGIVLDDKVHRLERVGEACLRVRWIWNGNEVVGKVDDKYNVRKITLYEETNPDVQRRVLDLLLSRLNSQTSPNTY